MPRITRVTQGLRLTDRGLTFQTVNTHPLDPHLWQVMYDDGHQGVFADTWLLDLANADQPPADQLQSAPGIVAQIIQPNVVAETIDISQRIDAPTPEQLDGMHMDAFHQDAFLFEIEYNEAVRQAYMFQIRYYDRPQAEIYNARLDIERNRPPATPDRIAADQIMGNITNMNYLQDEALVMDRTVRRTCPGCQGAYTGQLGQNHACTPVRNAMCQNCSSIRTSDIRPGSTDSAMVVCQQCQDNGATNCRKCGRVTGTRARGAKRICDSCLPRLENVIWDHVPNGRPWGGGTVTEIGSHRPFSVEIESFLDPRLRIDARRTLEQQGWQESGDGSVHADAALIEWAQANNRGREVQVIEFKSPPLTGDEGLFKLETDAKAIRRMGFRANSSCGLHVHVDAGGMDLNDKKSLFKFGKWYEEEIFKLVAQSRRENQYCRLLGPQLDEGNRYYWLNMRSITKHGTVEYRLHHGCTIYSRIAEWAKLCVKFTEAGLKMGRARSKPPVPLLDAINMSSYEKKYWTAVSLALHPPVAAPATPAPAPAPASTPEQTGERDNR